MDNKILITGGAGYIGNILTDNLLDKGNGPQVTIFDNLIHRQHGILENCAYRNFKFVYGDVRNQDLYKKLISEHDVIINLAAYVGMPLCKRFPVETKQVNQESAEFLAKTVSKDQHVIYMTTNSGYGIGEHKNGKAIYCTEETPLRPISLYGETKCAAEKALMDKGNATSLRLATVMGVSRKMRMDLLVNDFTWRAWNDRFIVLFESHFLRNFVHVRDVSKAIKFVMAMRDFTKGQVYNVGNTSANVNKMDLCLAIKKQVPDFYITESEINKDPDQRNYIVSNDKIEKLGWKPDYSLDDSIREVLQACPIIKNTNCSFSDI
jgi:nucleoside-diphosphate-sugar epimerase